MRIIYVPQYPSKMRYQEWWGKEFPKEFRKRGFEVLTLGEKYIQQVSDSYIQFKDTFSPVNESILLETIQINEYINLDIKDDDILFLADLSFPGLFCSALYHKRCSRMFAFCHATSINKLDYFQKVRYSKFPVESANSSLFDKIFVGSQYHAEKLQLGDILGLNWKNVLVTYLPFPKFNFKIFNRNKTIDIISASRPTSQKVDLQLENKIEKDLNLNIKRPISNTWFNYYWNLSSSKILLITSFEDTFGYQIVDAVLNNCIPLARNSFAYPELLSREYLYDNEDELEVLIERILKGEFTKVPKLLCEDQMNKFYDTICKEMRKIE